MTRAKPKPTIATREPAPKQRTENVAAVEAAPIKAAKGKTSVAKPALVKGVSSKPAGVKPTPAAKLAPAEAKPAPPTKSATGKVSAPKAVASKPKAGEPASKTAASKSAASSKAAPSKASPANGESAAAKPATKSAANKRPATLDTPAKIRPIEQAVGVSSDAVARRTGKSWAQWFALLDAAGAAELDHKGIVAVLAQRHGVGPWWQQMVTVAYEQARGKNGNAATDDGFQVDVSRVLELPLAKLFRFWAEPAERNKWLADDRFSIHKATASKSIRARWGRGVSRIDVDFCEKGPSKSQVTVQHNRIETSDAAEQMKAYWAKKIRALEALTRP
ncbi:MAG TPA: hypothetical protein VER96_11165 [Polyangiaceae bacterium]|nr:hypothetical protein [Polyangiaceae bacterium]